MQVNWRAVMKRQQIRKLFLIISLLLFPVTLYCFSPALIFEATGQGIINGSFIVFVLLFIFSIPFGRLFCSYLCPSGGLQECAFAITEKNPKQGWKNFIKYVIWGFLVFMVTLSFLNSKKIVTVDFFYQTEKGISVSSIQGYIIYYAILALIFIPSVLAGKRTFCHYFCWMAPFMILGLLSDRDLTGYEIKKVIDTTLNYFWSSSYASIYPALKGLVDRGLAIKRKDTTSNRNKLIYSITDEGRSTLRAWLTVPVEKDGLRYETLLKLFFGDEQGPKQTLLHIDALEEKVRKELAFFKCRKRIERSFGGR